MFKELAVDAIIVRKDRRPIEWSFVAELKQSIRLNGLLEPIVVTQDKRLVAGNHRLEAVKALGWKQIMCHIVTLDDLHADLAELDENLLRCELSTADRQLALVRRKELYESLYPDTKHAAGLGTRIGRSRNRRHHSGVSFPRPTSFTRDTMQQTGRSKTAIERDVKIGRAFTREQHGVLEDVKLPLLDRDWLATREDRSEIVNRLTEKGVSVLDEYRQPKEKPSKTKAQTAVPTKTTRVLALEELETVIQDDFPAFMRVSSALKEIRDRSLFLDQYGEFRRYVWQRWQIRPNDVSTAIVGVDVRGDTF
jgi:ParB family chromosome partitioning protein